MFSTDSGIKVAKKNKSVGAGYTIENIYQLFIESLPLFLRVSHSWGIGTDESDIIVILQWKSHCNKAFIDAYW